MNRIGVSKSDDKYNGHWTKVIYNEETYYVASRYVTTMQNPDEGFVEVTKTVKFNEKTNSLFVRDIPDMTGIEIGNVYNGEEIKVIAENTTIGWYKIEFTNIAGEKAVGYIASDAIYYEGATETSAVTSVETTEEATTEAIEG